MTLNEKLENFKDRAIKDAIKQSQTIINDCEKNIKTQIEDYTKKSQEKYINRVKYEKEIIVNQKNQSLSQDTLLIKQHVEAKRIELTNKLFDDVLNKLHQFRLTDDYKKLLITYINRVQEYACNLDSTIYISNNDSNLLDYLSNATNAHIKLIDKDYIGGIKGYVPDKNVLFDYTFASKLADEKANFIF